MGGTLRRALTAAAVPMVAVLMVAVPMAVVLIAAPAGAAPSPAPGPEATVVVRLPPGASLPPGTYQVVVRGSGRTVTGTGEVRPPAAGRTGGSGRVALLLGLLLVALAGVAAAGAALAARGPLRRNREFQRLAQLVADGRYADATDGLTNVEAQLPPARRALARFFLAFALYQVGELDEAEHRLAALHRTDPEHDEATYLLAYLRVQRRDFDGADTALKDLAARGRLGVGEARRLYGVVTYQRATRAVADGKIADAAELFEQVQRLGDFGDRVPADLRNRHAVLGARALLDGDLPAARGQFEELSGAAGDPDQRASALLGLALTTWLEHEPGSAVAAHRLLSQCLRLLAPDDPESARRRWPGPPSEQVEDRVRAARAAGQAPPAELDRRRTLRDIHLLRAMAMVRAVAEAERLNMDAARLLGGVTERLAPAVALDPAMADPFLIAGLLRYRLADSRAGGTTDAARQALAELRAARMLGARDPVLLQILNRHEERSRARREAWASRSRARPGRVPTVDDSPDAVPAARGTPTVAEVRERADLLAARLRNLAAGPHAAGPAESGPAKSGPAKSGPAKSGPAESGLESGPISGPAAGVLTAAGLAARLEETSAALEAQARTFEEAEADALARFGDRLLDEEAPT